MSNYSSIKAIIDANIRRNGKRAITGQVLNSVLNAMVEILGKGYQFVGVVTEQTDPGTPDARVFYLAEPGTFSQFGEGITIEEGYIGIISYDQEWVSSQIKVGSPNVVQYIAQVLSETEKRQARSNIGAASEEEVTEVKEQLDTLSDNSLLKTAQPLSEEEKSQVWENLGIDTIVNEEDIDFDADKKLQFANRSYDPANPDGMGYVILRKNKTFAEQVTQANTTYEIRYAFDLDGASVTIPAGCVLKFEGGLLSNGTLTGDGTMVDAKAVEVFSGITISGTWNVVRILSKWFNGSAVENCLLMNNAEINTEIIIDGDYSLYVPIASTSGLVIKENTIVRLSGVITKDATSVAISAMFSCRSNVSIIGGVLDGNKSNFGTEDEYGHGLEISSAKNVSISCVEIRNCRGDGVYVTGSSTGGASNGIIIENCDIHDCRRNGISVIYAQGMTIERTKIHDIQGKVPQAAIDVEPNYDFQLNEKILISECSLYDCIQGILFAGANAPIKECKVVDTSFVTSRFASVSSISKSKEVFFENCRFEFAGKQSSYVISGYNNVDIVFSNCSFVQNDEKISSSPYFFNEIECTCVSCRFDIKDGFSQIFSSRLFSCTICCSTFCSNTKSGGRIEDCDISSGGLVLTPTGSTDYAENFFMLNNVIRIRDSYYPINSSRLKNSQIKGNYLDLTSTIGRNLMNFLSADNVVVSDNHIVIGSNNNVISFDSASVNCQAQNNLFEVAAGVSHTAYNFVGINRTNGTANRAGDTFFFESLKRTLMFTGTEWVTFAGYAYNLSTKGTTAQRPTLTAAEAGFTYMDTTLGKMILWNGSAWVNMDGTALS